MLDIEATELEPTALISAILKAPVDLIWFGGIGTYVKAAAEPHIDVGDPGNDRLRVNGEDVRAAVLGEGPQRGVPQAAGIAFPERVGQNKPGPSQNEAWVHGLDNEVHVWADHQEGKERYIS